MRGALIPCLFQSQIAQHFGRSAASARVFGSFRLASSESSSCPFGVLGVPKSASYADVKQAFVKLALKHHPDTSTNQEDDVETFWKIRTAFESIGDENGTAVLIQTDASRHSSETWTDESLSAWFEQQTGRRLSFSMDMKTRREVAHVANTMSPGGLDRGGMWELARTVARHEKDGLGAVATPQQVSAGKTTRRRKRR